MSDTPLPELDPESRMLLAVGLGAVGGLFIGYQAVQHLFVQGVTSDERKNIIMYSAAVLAVWGLTKLVDLGEYQQYVDPLQTITGGDEQKAGTP